jgi:hypothetical protein
MKVMSIEPYRRSISVLPDGYQLGKRRLKSLTWDMIKDIFLLSKYYVA